MLPASLAVSWLPETRVGSGGAGQFLGSERRHAGPQFAPQVRAEYGALYDLGPERACGPCCRPGCRCGRFVEFSNSLFISYEIDDRTGVIEPMAEPFTETVIGTERVAMILQGAPSVFEIDDYRSLMSTVDGFIRARRVPEPLLTMCKRVLADHCGRCMSWLATARPPPGKDGRARIIKLLIRGVLDAAICAGYTAPIGFLGAMLDPRSAGEGGRREKARPRSRTGWRHISRRSRAVSPGPSSEVGDNSNRCRRNGNHVLTGGQIVHLEKDLGISAFVDPSDA